MRPARTLAVTPDVRRPFHNKIFFCDIVGYSRLEPVEQYRCQQRLTHVLREALRDMGLALEDDAIALPTGDGLVLNFLVQEPDVHLRIATETLRRLAEGGAPGDPALGLRIGLNSQVDTMVVDINDKRNIVGNGINFAQRVMDLGRHGQILMHDRVRLDLENYPHYADKVVYRGEYEVKHGRRVPVAQFVDAARPYVNDEPPPPPAAVPATPLDAILRHRAQESLLRVALDPSARHHLDDVRAYVTDFLAEREELQRLTVAVAWVASEMLDNAFRHGGLGPADTAVLAVDRTGRGVLVEVEQPDVTSFDVDLALCGAGPGFSFMRLMDRRGLRWTQRRADGRLTLALEIPRDVELGAADPPAPGTRPDVAGLPAAAAAFVDGAVDTCAYEAVTLVRLPWRRIDHASAPDGARAYLARHLAPGRGLVVDLGRLEYIASVGLRQLMLLAKQARGLPGARVVLAAAQPVVREILELSRFTAVLDVYPDSAVAFRALAR